MVRINSDESIWLYFFKKEACAYIKDFTSEGYEFICNLFHIKTNTARSYASQGRKNLTDNIIARLATVIIEEVIEENPTIEVAAVSNSACVDYRCNTCDKGIHTAYICEVFRDSTPLFLKIGKSSDVKTRMKNHARNTKYGGNTVVVHKIFAFDNEDDSLTMENYLRKYYKKIFSESFTPRDRFANCLYSAERDEENLIKIYQTIVTMGEEF